MCIGLRHDILEAYTFICHNYSGKEDEIILIGFSRGAFTARALAFLLDDIGVLRKTGLRHLHKIFDLWERQRSGSQDRAKIRELKDGLFRDMRGEHHNIKDVTIKACAVWDTVAALPGGKLKFIDERIPPNIELAIHALALNEERDKFTPLLWKNEPRSESYQKLPELRQCWFLGSHSDVGGGNKDVGLANIALAWVIAQLTDVVAFDNAAICEVSERYYLDTESCSEMELPDINIDETYELNIRLPVEEFQSRTDVHVSTFATAQRMIGWSLRKPFSSGSSTGEMVHWSVDPLLKNKIVHSCEALDKVKKTNPNPLIARRSDFEGSIITIWVAQDCLRMTSEMLKEVHKMPKNVIPTYAVLYSPEEWTTSFVKDYKIVIDLTIKQRATSANNKSEGRRFHWENKLHRDVSYLFSEVSLDWHGFHSLHIPTLEGKITVPGKAIFGAIILSRGL